MAIVNSKLTGTRVAVPESRQLDTLAQLLERRGAAVLRVPLVAIHDAPDPAPVLAWLTRFIEGPPFLFIILTGEGIRRLMSLAEQHSLRDQLVTTLASTTLLCRGPKPARVLRELGIKDIVQADSPTTDGVISTLKRLQIEDQRVAVQLYGEDPNEKLIIYLAERKAVYDKVAPYIYADESEESRVLELIQALLGKEVDVIAFTSQPQYRRLQQVARKHELLSELENALNNSCVAAVGPVVKEQLESNNIKVDIMPEQAYFMKPMVTAIMRYFE